ncbi:MAG: helix-turn-helix domain-containing protein [Halioglobus sp.]|nr:helix-turn-helix domain-containing protein [Halioglobus sp.]
MHETPRSAPVTPREGAGSSGAGLPEGLGAFVDALVREYAASGGDLGALGGSPVTTLDAALGILEHCITALSERANREGELPPMSREEVDMLCFCVITCTTLHEAIERAARFCAMLGGRGAHLRLEIEGGRARFHMATRRLRDSPSALLTDLFGLAFYRRLFAWLTGSPLPIRGYAVYANQVMERDVLEGFFLQALTFGAPDNSFDFPAELLMQPVVRDAAQLKEVLAVLPFDQLFEPGRQWRFRDTVAGIIQTQLMRSGRIPRLEQIARFFHTSPATFHRRLVQEGTTYAAIKREQRAQRARALLLHTKAKVEDIAAQLDFSDVRAFRRAFRAWTGMSPQAWRETKSR